MTELTKDPYSVIITGVGGQGNVLSARVLSGMLARQGYYVTIGETFGSSQRGGSVMSHIRVSKAANWSPQIPKGMADVVVSLEPIEVMRVLKDYGNPDVIVLSNTRPVYPVGVIAGDLAYPSLDEIKTTVSELSSKAWFIDAIDEGMKLGHPILGNIVILGALSALNVLPMTPDDFKAVMLERLSAAKLDMNLAAYRKGQELIEACN